MFRKLRRKDRKLNHEDAVKLLKKGEYGTLSTVDRNGYPYGVPLSYAYLDGAIYFHSAREGHKLDNISENRKVSFSVVGDTEVLSAEFSTDYESVILFGEASEVEGEEKDKALLALIEKYSPDYLDKGEKYIDNAKDKTAVVKMTIEKITGKAGR